MPVTGTPIPSGGPRLVYESILLSRLGLPGGFLDLLGIDLAATGSNPALNDPLRQALRRMGFAIADPSAVSDADVAAVPAAREDEFLARAEIRLLETVIESWARPNIQTLDARRDWGALMANLVKLLDSKRQQLIDEYGPIDAARGFMYLNTVPINTCVGQNPPGCR